MLNQIELELSACVGESAGLATSTAATRAASKAFVPWRNGKLDPPELNRMVTVLVGGAGMPQLEKIIWKAMDRLAVAPCSAAPSGFQQLVGKAFQLMIRGYSRMIEPRAETAGHLTKKQVTAELHRVVHKILQYNTIVDPSVLLGWIKAFKPARQQCKKFETLTSPTVQTILLALTEGAGSLQMYEPLAAEISYLLGHVMPRSFEGQDQPRPGNRHSRRAVEQAKRLFRSIGPGRWERPVARSGHAGAQFELLRHDEARSDCEHAISVLLAFYPSLRPQIPPT